jgi:FRG domain
MPSNFVGTSRATAKHKAVTELTDVAYTVAAGGCRGANARYAFFWHSRGQRKFAYQMTKPNEHNVKTLTQFTEVVEKLSLQSRAKRPATDTEGNWYRGVGKAKSFRLVPSLYRHPTTTKFSELIKLESVMIDDFNRQSVLHNFSKRMESLQDPQARFEMLFYMQHYSVPTRLLDWTGNPFIALFFALTDPARGVKEKQNIAVWIFDPVAWNRKALEDLAWEHKGPATTDSPNIQAYFPIPTNADDKLQTIGKTMYPFPVAFYGVSNNARIFAQKGVFTCFGSNNSAMENIYDKNNFPQDSLFKVIIENQDVDPMLKMLISIGYTDSVSYPDLHGLALEIKRLRGFRT